MGNKQIEKFIQNYKAQQNQKGLKGPNYEKKNRLFLTLKFYDDVNKIFIQDKIFFNSSDNSKFEDFIKKVEANFDFYTKKLEKQNFPFFVVPHKNVLDQCWIITRQELKYNLKSRLHGKMELSESDKFFIISQIIMALTLLHISNLPHDALNPSNILLTHDNLVYLTDFGLINPHFYLNQDLDQLTLFNPKIDKGCYFAPEIFTTSGNTKIIDFQNDKEENECLKKADVFSLGCVIYQILTNDKVLFNHLALKNFTKTENYQEYLKEDLKNLQNEKYFDFLMNLLNPDQTKRIDSFQAFRKWHKIHFGNQSYFIYFFNYLLRHRLFSYPDHKTFLIAAFFDFCNEKKLYGCNKQEMKFSLFSNFSFKRVHQIFDEILEEKFIDIFNDIIKKEEINQLNEDISGYNKHLDIFLEKISIKQFSLQKMEMIYQQHNLQQEQNKNENSYFDIKNKKKQIIEKILEDKNYQSENTLQMLIKSFYGKFALNQLNLVNSFETRYLILELLKEIKEDIPQIELIIYQIPKFIFSLTEDSHIPKIKLLRIITEIVNSIKFIRDKRFCKQHSVENYIFSLIDKILSIQNFPLLHQEFINNIEKYIHLNMVFIVSFSCQVSEIQNAEQILKEKHFVVNHFKQKQFFMNWIKKLLESIEYKNIMLQKLPSIFPYLDNNLIIKNINPLVINYLNYEDSLIQCILLLPFLINGESFKFLQLLPFLDQKMTSEREDVIFAFLETASKIIQNFQNLDIIFFKEIIQKLIQIQKQNESENILFQIKLLLEQIFQKIPINEINIHFSDLLQILFDKTFYEEFTENILIEEIQIMQLQLKKPLIIQNLKSKNQSFINMYSFFRRETLHFNLINCQNIIEEIYRFIFSSCIFELIEINGQENLQNFEQFLDLIQQKMNSLVNLQKVPWDFQTEDQKEMDFSMCMKIFKIIKNQLLQNKVKNLNKIFNREIFLSVIEFFEKLIEVFQLENYQYKILNTIILQPASLRQINLQGNLVSTIYGSDSGISKLANIGKNCFITGTHNGKLSTYNFENLKKNVPSLFHQDFQITQDEKVIKIQELLGLQNVQKVLIGTNNKKLFLYDAEKNKIEREISLQSKISKMCLIDKNFADFENSILISQQNGLLQIIDLRQSDKIQSELKIGTLLGIPTALTTTKVKNQSYIGTARGFLMRYDM